MSARFHSRRQRHYAMDYISDPILFKAVMFARSMIRNGKPAGLANTIAANYYEVEVSDVAHYVGQAAAHSRRRRQ